MLARMAQVELQSVIYRIGPAAARFAETDAAPTERIRKAPAAG
jgi:hypothetical protein